ncbi:YhjD/YihY/BrkB family envelope integrity protein [Phytohabitans houttuyneae]|uniref:YhjD/YihY/BrkB family envelope integrity protein n=1 Tax=Phytohabitans houttuyneae TaxID=1076126 RepID=UPI0015641567|nr:YhjD/YihY/BrkB family envelope integrity protein [Phytohabitans houttuyneae]
MWGRLRAVAAAAARRLRGRDVALHAAAVTFYGAVAVVPVVLLATWLAGLVGGAERVRRLGGYAVDALPTAIGADRVVAALLRAGLDLTPMLALAALLPATFYGEGLRRAFASIAGSGGAQRLIGWRGRLRLVPLLALTPALLLAVLATLPLTTRLVGRGGWSGVLGVVLSFLACWLALTPVLFWVYRVVAPGDTGWPATALVGSFTAANISGFLHGLVLFAALPLDLGLPFGGLDAVGAAVALLLWLYLFHVIVLVGYATTLAAASPDVTRDR